MHIRVGDQKGGFKGKLEAMAKEGHFITGEKKIF
jgi:hypothetical protein